MGLYLNATVLLDTFISIFLFLFIYFNICQRIHSLIPERGKGRGGGKLEGRGKKEEMGAGRVAGEAERKRNIDVAH